MPCSYTLILRPALLHVEVGDYIIAAVSAVRILR